MNGALLGETVRLTQNGRQPDEEENSMNSTVGGPNFDEVVKHPDHAFTGYSYFSPTESAMKDLIDELFVHNWKHIVVGPCIEGAVFEIIFKAAPEVGVFDGYLTVDLGPWHFHL